MDARLIQTNIPPLEEDAFRAAALIRDEEAEFKNVEAQIAELARRRDVIHGRLCMLKNVVSASRRVPHEIVAEIFRLCFVSCDSESPSSSNISNVLSQICSGWRQVALQTPFLWWDIRLEFRGEMSPRAMAGYMEIAKLWIGRCQNFTFGLAITTMTKADHPLNPVKEILLIEPEGIATLELHLHEAYLPVLAELSADCFPSLTRFEGSIMHSHTRFGGQVSWAAFPSDIKAFKTAPMLDTLRFTVEQPLLDGTSLPFPWDQLLVLDLRGGINMKIDIEGGIEPDSMRRVLEQCHRLERCSITLSKADTVATTPLSLRNLESLDLLLESAQTHGFLSNMKLPKLRDLKVSSMYDFAILPLESMIDMLRLSQCKLEELSFSGGSYIVTEQLLQVLELAPSIRKLSTLFAYTTPTDYASYLIYNRGSRYLLPNLRSLSIDFSKKTLGPPLEECRQNLLMVIMSRGHWDIPDHASLYIREDIGSGPATAAKLEEINVYFPDDAEGEDCYQQFTRTGLHVNIQEIPRYVTRDYFE